MAKLTQAEYARHRGCSRQAVSKALKVGRITADAQGLIDQDDADQKWKLTSSPQMSPNSLRGTATAEPPPQEATNARSAAGTFANSRAVRESYLARLAKLDYEEKSGLLVRKDLVRRTTFEQHRKVRDLLLSIPDRLTPLMATTSEEAARIYTVLMDESQRLCQELSGEPTGGRGRTIGGGELAGAGHGGGVQPAA